MKDPPATSYAASAAPSVAPQWSTDPVGRAGALAKAARESFGLFVMELQQGERRLRGRADEHGRAVSRSGSVLEGAAPPSAEPKSCLQAGASAARAWPGSVVEGDVVIVASSVATCRATGVGGACPTGVARVAGRAAA